MSGPSDREGRCQRSITRTMRPSLPLPLPYRMWACGPMAAASSACSPVGDVPVAPEADVDVGAAMVGGGLVEGVLDVRVAGVVLHVPVCDRPPGHVHDLPWTGAPGQPAQVGGLLIDEARVAHRWKSPLAAIIRWMSTYSDDRAIPSCISPWPLASALNRTLPRSLSSVTTPPPR